LETYLQEFSARNDVAAVMQGLDWTVGYADLRESVLSFQRLVITGDAVARVASATLTNTRSVAEITLPEASAAEFQGTFDPGQWAFSVSSRNPNLRVAGFSVIDHTPAGAEKPEKVFGFQIGFGARFLQLVEYQGRWMVRDGYHRVYGLLSKGVATVPCVVVRAKTFEETGAGRPGFFGYEVLYGPRPPRVTDFIDDHLAGTVHVPQMVRVIRLRAEEFSIPAEPDEPVPPGPGAAT
jgi:hypothetical protein